MEPHLVDADAQHLVHVVGLCKHLLVGIDVICIRADSECTAFDQLVAVHVCGRHATENPGIVRRLVDLALK